LKIAVFIDFDNIEIGVKTTLGQAFDIAAILEAIKERGEVVTKVAYGDWKRAGEHGRQLSQHAIRMVQRNLTPGGDKNGADINLALDALEMAFTHDHINAFVIVGGDSDFITLVEKLKQYDKKVFVVGGRQFTSLVMQKNCHEFLAYENLVGRRSGATEKKGSAQAGLPASDVSKAFPLVKRALKVLVDREVSPQLGLLKSTLLQLDSTFSERDYGASTFRDFIEKVAQTGLVALRHSGRSLLVELPETNGGESGAAPSTSAAPLPPSETIQEAATESAVAEPVIESPDTGNGAAAAADRSQARQAIQRAEEIFQRAAPAPRWPMYVRQVKQYLRAADEGFDERKWGFSTIVEFLRACQREGVFRMERDRQGVLRIFPGPSLQQRPAAPLDVAEPVEEVDTPELAVPEPRAAAAEGADGAGSLDSQPQPDVVIEGVTVEPEPGAAPEPAMMAAEEEEVQHARVIRPRRSGTRKTAARTTARRSAGGAKAASRTPRARKKAE
jgi:uncharacterized LabA/DUF88 family protein